MTSGKLIFGQLVLKGCVSLPFDFQTWPYSPIMLNKVPSTQKTFHWLY